MTIPEARVWSWLAVLTLKVVRIYSCLIWEEPQKIIGHRPPVITLLGRKLKIRNRGGGDIEIKSDRF